LLAPVPLRVIPEALTVIPVPTFTELKVEVAAAQLRPETVGDSVQLVVAVVVPSYGLELAVTLGTNCAAVMFAVVFAVVEVSA
jgi:hypothetical protein